MATTITTMHPNRGAVRASIARITDPDGVAEVVLERLCPDCHGDKRVQDPEWAAWIARYNEAEAELLHTGFSYPDAAEQAAQAAGPEPDGPEERDCGTCEGHGKVPTQSGRALLAFVREWSL